LKKCANVLLGTDGVIKLADFGAAKYIEDNYGLSKLKTIAGTPYWMAPEVVLDKGYGIKADIWSLGCTIIEMFTGSHPWSEYEFTENLNVFHLLSKTEETPEIPQGISAAAQDFLSNCLIRDVNQRADCEFLLSHHWLEASSYQ
jgi:mitogen-activated protein kinase kinase kinase 3